MDFWAQIKHNITMTKFNEETKGILLNAISKGAPYKMACNAAGIKYETFRLWRNKAKDAPESNKELFDFFVALKKAQGEAALKWLEIIDNAMPQNWQAAAWKLERLYYSQFSSNPLVREEFKKLELSLRRIEQRQGAANAKETKELHPESD